MFLDHNLSIKMIEACEFSTILVWAIFDIFEKESYYIVPG